MKVKIEGKDLAEMNMELAEKSLIKAETTNHKNSKIRSLMFAKKSIENALQYLGVDDKDFEAIGDSSSSETSHRQKQ